MRNARALVGLCVGVFAPLAAVHAVGCASIVGDLPAGTLSTEGGGSPDSTTGGEGGADGASVEGGSDGPGSSDEAGLPSTCNPGDKGCEGNTPWECVDGGPLEAPSPCSDQTCASGACTGVCAPLQTQCLSGNSAFQTCASGGTWTTSKTCAPPTGGVPTCAPDAGCGAGTCVPDGGAPVLCGTTCVDTQTDGYNCGLCGQTCTGTTCAGGYCAPQMMCNGSTLTASNTENGATMGLQTGKVTLGTNGLYAYFTLGGTVRPSVYGCLVSGPAPTPPPTPIEELASGGAVTCFNDYGNVAGNQDAVYTFQSFGGDCRGQDLWAVYGQVEFDGEISNGTLVGDVATSDVYTLVSPTVNLLDFQAEDGGTNVSASSCLTVSGTLADGAAGGGTVVAVDSTGDVIVGTTVSQGACSTQKMLASGVTMETAIAVSPSGALFAFADETDVYLCSTTAGCTSAELANPFASNQGTILQSGIVFDTESPPHAYWFSSKLGLVRCSAVLDSTCTPTVLVPPASVTTTSGIGVDSEYVYYLQASSVYRVPK